MKLHLVCVVVTLLLVGCTLTSAKRKKASAQAPIEQPFSIETTPNDTGAPDAADSTHTNEEEENGGFVKATRLHEADYACTIPRVHIDSLTRETFLDLYHNKQAVMIEGGVLHWPAQSKWTKEFMQRTVRDSNSIYIYVCICVFPSLSCTH